MTAWLCWVRRFDESLEPQIVREFIPATLKKEVRAQYVLTPVEATLSVAELAALYPPPKVTS